MPPKPPTPSTERASIPVSPGDTPPHVLVVEDDRLSSRVLGKILTEAGCSVAFAESGEGALAAFRSRPSRLILLDVMMEGMDGFEACRRFKTEYGEACPPILFITAKSGQEDIVEGFKAGGVDYLPKPFHAREVVARVRAHLQNQILAEQQKSLIAQLSTANESKNRFLGMAAHDLRNPLAAIRAFSEFLQEDTAAPLTAGQLEMVRSIHDASRSMLNLVNELLDVAIIEANELRLDLQEHRLADLIAESVRLQNLEAARKGSRVSLSGNLQPAVRADGAKLRQVADNLINNAVKYSPRDSGIEVEVFGTAETCGFAVRDRGPGIPEAERDRLFTDFGRLSARPTAGESSTGLGLAICRKIVTAHRGSIEVRNLPAGGCEFRVTLPQA